MPVSPSVKPATSHDVARLAGVSRSTVSNILNGNDARFPSATRQKVLDAARELDYRPSLAARSLVSGRSDTVIVLLPNTTFGGNLQDAVDEAVSATMPLGGNVVVRFAGETPKATYDAINALRPLAVLAFSPLTPAHRSALESAGTIVVPGTEPSANPAQLPDGGVGQMQADLLLRSGPRQLWFAALSDRRQDIYGPGRLAALEQYCQERDLPAPKRVAVPLTVDGATAALEKMLDGDTRVGVACYNDDVALALLSAARRMGVVVPDRLSIVGVDHTPVAQLWSPRLTTIDTDLRGLVAEYSSELRIRLSGGEHMAPAPHRFTVVEGETT